MFLKILEPRDINNGISLQDSSSLRINNLMEAGSRCHMAPSNSTLVTNSQFHSNAHQTNVGPTAASALLFNTTASINKPSDINIQLSGGYEHNTAYHTSSWPQNVANFRQQQQLQRNLLIFKQQKAAAAAQNQQQNYIRQQNNLSYKRVLYQNPGFSFVKPIPPPPPPPLTPVLSVKMPSLTPVTNQQEQLNRISFISTNNAANSSDLSQVISTMIKINVYFKFS